MKIISDILLSVSLNKLLSTTNRLKILQDVFKNYLIDSCNNESTFAFAFNVTFLGVTCLNGLRV